MHAASSHKASDAMGTASFAQDGAPPPDDVRAQVQRMAASDVFASSPQLAAFLVFVVEAVLRGKGERLKGYTIGVEVLRRDPNFNPQLDPIVRVEATRLRRAIGRYYAGIGVNDPVQIDLPRGGYAPHITWRAGTSMVAPPPPPGLVLGPGNGLPTVRIAPFVVFGTPDTGVVAAETLGSKIAEAFAQFDIVNVTVAAPQHRSGYRLDGAMEYRGNQTVDLRFKLIDEADSTVIWSRAFERLSGADRDGDIERRIILEIATAIVQPFGVISANDATKYLASGDLDPRYVCLLQVGQALRSFDTAAHIEMRARLQQLIALDPNFAIGFTLLAVLYAREFIIGIGVQDDELPPLDRALRAVRRGIELKPQGARGYHILFTILFMRGEKEAGIAAAEKAIALNPYDLLILAEYGGRLIYCGEVDRGMTILREAVGFGAVLPAWSHFSLFVGHYVRGEIAEARYQASQMTTETYVFGQLARALIAHADHDAAEVERSVQGILALQPSWRDDSRREIGKLVTAASIADRLAGDLRAAAPKAFIAPKAS
jgi:tetratricopeptide (TPR) repeat protein